MCISKNFSFTPRRTLKAAVAMWGGELSKDKDYGTKYRLAYLHVHASGMALNFIHQN
jgi:hypothetical protein